jgi:tRNA pseudouridine55 synthase
VETTRPWQHVTTEDLEEAIRAQFLGPITQRPPMYSAVKVKGERLYKKARRGETATRPPRQVTVYEYALTGREGADVHFRIQCSKGTYVRSLAHDLGEAVGAGAHLTALRRTAIGPYRVEDAWRLSDLGR